MERLLIDIGGTYIKCSDGRSIPVDSAGSREGIVASLREAVAGYEGVSVAVPGPFDYHTGQFLMKHKFQSVYGERFSELTGVSDCRFIHDVNCMLLGEMTKGNGAGYKRVALVALGTGLGFALSIDGKILVNNAGSPAVTIYHRPYRDGILEDYVSKRGLIKLFDEGDNITVKEIAEMAKSGNGKAVQAFKTMGSIIGEQISPVLNEYKVECLLLGGQISRSADLFLDVLSDKLEKSGCSTVILPVSDFDNATFFGLENI